MKRIIFIIILNIFGYVLYAQNTAKIRVVPANVDALTPNVTIFFDVKGTTMAGQPEAYLWSWSNEATPSEMKICGTQWGSILPSAKLENAPGETDVYMLKLPLTTEIGGVETTFNNLADLFNVSPGKLKRIGFLLRDIAGNTQTEGDFATELKLAPLIFEDREFRTFPSAVSVKDVVTVILRPSLSTVLKVQIMENIKLKLQFMGEGDEIIAETPEYIELNKDPNGRWSYTFLIDKLVNIPEGKDLLDILKMKVKYMGTVNKPDGSTEDVEREFEQDFKLYE